MSSYVQTIESDEMLVGLLKDGYKEALTALFDRYQKLVFTVAVRILKDRGEAEEAVQQTFLDVFRFAEQFDSRKGDFKGWILTVAYHIALHRKRHLKANGFYKWDAIEAALDCPVQQGSPISVRLAKEMLARLKPKQRKVLELTYYEGMTAEEIAEELKVSVHSVRHDLYRGLKLLVEDENERNTD